MTYRCKIGRGMEHIGIMPHDEPSLYCDGCGRRLGLYSRGRYRPPQWFLDGKPAPGWTGGEREDGTREDYCQACSREVRP